MSEALQILEANGKKVPNFNLDLIYEKEQQVPDSIQYSVRRYYSPVTVSVEDTGMLIYHYNNSEQNNFIELRFCISGNRYCNEQSCSNCNSKPTQNCAGLHETIDLFSFHFTSSFLHQFVQNVKLNSKKDAVLAFKYPESFSKIFPVCNIKRTVLDDILNHSYSGALENIFVNAKVHELLVNSLQCLINEKEEGFACKFLADESGKERIYQAREILLQRIGEPITIKALSRKVAINECYLKKGFKEVFGTTIFDFYQQQRMEHAKYLLYEKGLNVTDVSALLGYSSISHFSAAFKKHTGLKPCELLH
jgi:AraC-like DNA-binding protein